MATVSESSILTIINTTIFSIVPGLENLPGCFLKDGAKFLYKSISNLCNLSITSEKLSDSCKVAKVKPLYKKGSLTLPCNHRPKALLPLISKVIEKVIHEQASTFLISRDLLSTY